MTVLFVLTGGSLQHQPGNLQRFFGGFHATKNHGKPKAIKVNRLGGNPERAEITRKPSTDLFVDCRVVGKTPKFECGFSDVLFKDVLRVIYASTRGHSQHLDEGLGLNTQNQGPTRMGSSGTRLVKVFRSPTVVI